MTGGEGGAGTWARGQVERGIVVHVRPEILEADAAPQAFEELGDEDGREEKLEEEGFDKGIEGKWLTPDYTDEAGGEAGEQGCPSWPLVIEADPVGERVFGVVDCLGNGELAGANEGEEGEPKEESGWPEQGGHSVSARTFHKKGRN